MLSFGHYNQSKIPHSETYSMPGYKNYPTNLDSNSYTSYL